MNEKKADEAKRSGARERILDVARRLFMEQGYRGLSMRALAERAHTSKALLYYYFKDKEELFLAVLQDYLAQMERLILASRQRGETSRQRITLLIQAIMAQPAEQRAAIRLASQELVHLSEGARRSFRKEYQRRFLRRLQAILQEGIATGELRPIDPKIMTWALLGMLYPYFYPGHRPEVRPTPETVDRILDIYFEGVSAPGTRPHSVEEAP